jgi:hypothetical protein
MSTWFVTPRTSSPASAQGLRAWSEGLRVQDGWERNPRLPMPCCAGKESHVIAPGQKGPAPQDRPPASSPGWGVVRQLWRPQRSNLD